MNLRNQGGVDWAEMVMRVLSVHYFAPQLDLIFEMHGEVFVYAGTHEICRGDTLGEALDAAVAQLTDADIEKALEATGDL